MATGIRGQATLPVASSDPGVRITCLIDILVEVFSFRIRIHESRDNSMSLLFRSLDIYQNALTVGLPESLSSNLSVDHWPNDVVYSFTNF